MALIVAAAIFLVDTLSSLEFAVAVLYIFVVMLAADGGERSVLGAGAICVFLTTVSFAITHGRQAAGVEELRALVSLSAIGITTLLALRMVRAAERLAASERKRANLSRFFSPSMVDQLADAEVPASFAREQLAAVMFVDIVGFTNLASRMPAGEAVAVLREVLAIMADAVFRNHGTIDKFLGDGLLAVFGVPVPGRRDATNAVLCAGDISRRIAAWNKANRRGDQPEIRMAMGIHFGEVVFGNVGTEDRLELTVLGETVNLASRIESYCRRLDAEILVSGSVVARLLEEGSDHLAAEFADEGTHALRGMNHPVRLYRGSLVRAGEPVSAVGRRCDPTEGGRA